MRGSSYFQKISAVIIASFRFGLGHFAYLLNPISSQYSFWLPFIWFLQTFTVGIILSLIVLRKKWLFPVIFAHSVNNIITAHAFWNYLQGNEFLTLGLVLYTPLLIISAILLIWQFPRIKESVLIGIKDLKTYTKDGASKGDKIVII